MMWFFLLLSANWSTTIPLLSFSETTSNLEFSDNGNVSYYDVGSESGSGQLMENETWSISEDVATFSDVSDDVAVELHAASSNSKSLRS